MSLNDIKAVQDFYDGEAHQYFSSRYIGGSADNQVWRARADLVLDLVGSVPGVVVDLGCGPGVLAPRLIDHAENVVSADLSFEMLRTGRAGLGEHESAHWVNCDLTSLPLRTASVEALLVIGVFGLVSDTDRALAEFARVVRPSGRLLLQAPSGRNPRRWVGQVGKNLGLAKKQAYEVRLAGGRIDPRPYPVEELERAVAAHGFAARRRRFYDFRVPLLEKVSTRWDARMERALHRALSRRRVLGQLGEGMVLEFVREG